MSQSRLALVRVDREWMDTRLCRLLRAPVASIMMAFCTWCLEPLLRTVSDKWQKSQHAVPCAPVRCIGRHVEGLPPAVGLSQWVAVRFWSDMQCATWQGCWCRVRRRAW